MAAASRVAQIGKAEKTIAIFDKEIRHGTEKPKIDSDESVHHFLHVLIKSATGRERGRFGIEY
jgi:hypothetical protein